MSDVLGLEYRRIIARRNYFRLVLNYGSIVDCRHTWAAAAESETPPWLRVGQSFT